MTQTFTTWRSLALAGAFCLTSGAFITSCAQASEAGDPAINQAAVTPVAERKAASELPKGWAPVALHNQDETTSAFVVTRAGTIVAGTSAGLLLSEDGGQTWHPPAAVEGDKAAVFSLSTDESGVLYAGLSKYGVLVSADNGKTWKLCSEGLNPGGPRSSYAILASGPNVLKGTYESGMYLSEDKGRTWQPSNRGIPLNLSTNRMVSVTQLVKNDKTVYALTDLGVRYSHDHGRDWNKPRHNGIERLGYMLSLAVKGDTLYAGVGTSGKGMYYSVDNGESWVHMGLPEEEPSALYVDNNGYLYAGTVDGKVYRTTNGGRNWELVSEGLPQNEGIYAISATPEGRLLAGVNRKGIYLLR